MAIWDILGPLASAQTFIQLMPVRSIISRTTATSILFYRFGRYFRPVVISLCFLSLLTVALYQEILAYRWMRSSWPRLEPRETNSRYLRLLIVADPQLIGYRNDLPGILGSIARFDADNYLSRGFSQAFHHHRPDMIVFLGDLFDEGSTSTNEEFLSTLKRFRRIFSASTNTLFVYIPGDNDVGGEGNDRFSNVAQRRFVRHFDTAKSQMNFISFRFLKFTQASVMSGEYRQIGQISPNATDDEILSILISHFPLLDAFDFTAERILQTVRPHLILSAHDHKARIQSRKNVLQREATSITMIRPGIDFVFSKTFLKQDGKIDGYPAYEILSPTCSYRMGVRHMGYGAMLIEQFKNKSVAVKYTIFWTLDRYDQLYNYLAFLCVVFCCVILCTWVSCYRRIYRFCTSSSSRSANKRSYDPLNFTY